ncbi:MAG: FliM/FliN family flagellar motor C-terminal domain-containing protein [Phycisphaerae bacterium]|nr:FliM/FliN family flagellar motor C-terminal domain-containing protein [Phycisphaerae bacterium]
MIPVSQAGGEGAPSSLRSVAARARVRITLGTATLSPSRAEALRVGSVITLDQSPDAPVRVQAEGGFVGQGQAVAVADSDGRPRLAVAMMENHA